MANNKIYFKNLDSIRFFAAFMVFLSHAMTESYKYLNMQGTFVMKILNTISSGPTGVSMFFVLSGFLITYLLISEYEVNGSIILKNFYLRRVLRIWPLYFAIVIFGFFIYPFFKSFTGYTNNSQANVLYYLTFLSNFDLIRVEHYFNGQDNLMQDITWSVSVEEQFYLFWPLLFTFLPIRFWKYGIASVIVGSIGFRLANYNDHAELLYSTFAVLMDLGLGSITAYLIKSHIRVRTFFESASTPLHLSLFIASFALLLWGDLLFPDKYSFALTRVLAAASFALIIAAQAITQKESFLNLGKISFANYWGKYTYGIYLIHPIALTAVDVAFRVAHINRSNFSMGLVYSLFACILTLLLSWISYNYFESKFLALKDRYTVIQTH